MPLANELGACPVKAQLSPLTRLPPTHTSVAVPTARPNERVGWSCSGGFKLPCSNWKAALAAEIFTEAFMCQLGFNCALACLHLYSVASSQTASASICVVSPSLLYTTDHQMLFCWSPSCFWEVLKIPDTPALAVPEVRKCSADHYKAAGEVVGHC